MLIINIVGILLIALIIWWFWLYRPKEAVFQQDKMTILVENGIYQPSRIKIHVNQATRLQFIRKDASPCAETLVFPELEISETLPLNRPKSIALPALPAGVYHFHCQMQMYCGELHVE